MTRGLTAFAGASLPSANLVPDITATGLSAQALFNGIETGEFTAGYMASGYLTSRVPELGILDIPFSVTDRAEAFSRLDGAAGERLAEAVSASTDLVVLAFWDNGFRHLTNAVGPIRTPRDCQGLKVRTLNNQLYQDTMAAIGFEPVVTDVKELVSACESGLVQAQENPLTNMLTFGLDRWHHYVSLTGHIFGIVLLVAHKPWFDALDDNQQVAIRAGASSATRLQRDLALAEDVAGIETLLNRGVEVLHSDEINLEAFRRSIGPLQEAALSKLPDKLVELYLS